MAPIESAGKGLASGLLEDCLAPGDGAFAEAGLRPPIGPLGIQWLKLLLKLPLAIAYAKAQHVVPSGRGRAA